MKHTFSIELNSREEKLIEWFKLYEDTTSESAILKQLLKEKLEEQLIVHAKDLKEYDEYISSKGYKKGHLK